MRDGDEPGAETPSSSVAMTDDDQGMTIRTARLPGAGNLLGRAGEDLSSLPDWASRYEWVF